MVTAGSTDTMVTTDIEATTGTMAITGIVIMATCIFRSASKRRTIATRVVARDDAHSNNSIRSAARCESQRCRDFR